MYTRYDHFLPRIQEFQYVCCIFYIFCVSLSVRVCSTGHVRHCDKQTSRRQEQCFARIEPQIQAGEMGDGTVCLIRVGYRVALVQSRVEGNHLSELDMCHINLGVCKIYEISLQVCPIH